MDRNIDPEKMSVSSFSSRKRPEYMCYRLLRCPVCDLVYAVDAPDQLVLESAYQAADFASSSEAEDAAFTYGQAIRPFVGLLSGRQSALEIGTGTGAFLDVLRQLGFEQVIGVEPSRAAIDAAPVARRTLIREGVFRSEDFLGSKFDLICCFMTLEHVRNPKELILQARDLLRPGGAVVVVVHDCRGLINRILGRRSPIIDIEHVQIFSRKSIQYLFYSSGFSGVSVKGFSNRYSLRYWISVSPFGDVAKDLFLRVFGVLGLSEVKMSFNVGNVMAVGFKR